MNKVETAPGKIVSALVKVSAPPGSTPTVGTANLRFQHIKSLLKAKGDVEDYAGVVPPRTLEEILIRVNDIVR